MRDGVPVETRDANSFRHLSPGGWSLVPTKTIPTPTGYASEEIFFRSIFADAQEWIPEMAWPTSIPTLSQMRRDGVLSAVLTAYTLPIRKATWAVDPAGCRPEVAQVVADDLGLRVLGDDTPRAARVRGVSWHEHLRAALLHLTYGHYAFELGAEIDPSGLARLTSLSERVPHTIVNIEVNRNGDLVGIEQYAMPGESTQPLIPAERLLWYCHDREGAAWQGSSLLRAGYPAWLMKREMMRVHATSNRRFGMGVPTIEWLPGSTPTPAQHADAQKAASAARVGDQSGLALPPGARLVLAGLSGGVPNTLEFLQWLNREMTKMVLAQFLELGETAHGSRALGSSFIDLFMLSIQAIGQYTADTVTRQVAARIVEWNWGPDEPVPAVTVNDVASTHEVTAETLAQLMQFGAITPDPALDEYVRDLWGLPKRTGPWVNPKGAGAPGPTAKPTPTPNPSEDTQASRRARHVHAAAGGGPREPTDAEQQAGTDFEAHQQAHEDAVAALLAAWPAIAAAMILLLGKEAADAVAAGNLAALGSLTVPAATVTEIGNELAVHMATLADHAAGQVVAEAAHQGVDIAAPADAGAEQVQQVAQAVAGIVANGYQSAAARVAMQAAQPGVDAKAVEDDVITALDDMSSSDSGWVADNLAGALTAAQNAGRMATMDAHPPKRVVASEILDSSTCDPCKKVDGREYATVAAAKADYPVMGYRACAGGMRCRGTAVPLWK